MEVYLDYIFLENLIINISIFYQISIFSKKKVNIFKIILASIFLSIISIICKFEIVNNLLVQILSINIVIYLLYKSKKILEYFKYQLYYYAISMIYIGIIISTSILFKINLESIVIRIGLYITSSIITYITYKYIFKIIFSKVKYFNLTYKIILKDFENVSFKVFVDTGNNLKDNTTNLDVIVLNESMYIKKIGKNILEKSMYRDIKIDVITATGKSFLKGYVFKNVLIKKGGVEKAELKKVIILFINEKIKNDEYDGILSYDTYLNKLGDE